MTIYQSTLVKEPTKSEPGKYGLVFNCNLEYSYFTTGEIVTVYCKNYMNLIAKDNNGKLYIKNIFLIYDFLENKLDSMIATNHAFFSQKNYARKTKLYILSSAKDTFSRDYLHFRKTFLHDETHEGWLKRMFELFSSNNNKNTQ